ncbi:MAG: hypothetical protein AABZ39_06325 [Spirochaetota bacterium]
MKKQNGDTRAWLVTANMGLGHLRAAYPLKQIAEEGIITVGYDPATPGKEARLWKRLQSGYEILSRIRMVPLIGKTLHKILDALLYIPPLYPLRDLSHPSFQVKIIKSLVRRGLCKDLLTRIHTKPIPLITSFYAPALAADMANYSRIYCIICDADINRAWVAEDPKKSRINYLLPCGMALRRIKEYGVPDERLFLTGFPFPLELIGDRSLDILRQDVAERLRVLDPNDRFWPLHGKNVVHFLGKENCTRKPKFPFTITFAVGGAGAQTETGMAVARSLKQRLTTGGVRLNLVAGVRKDVFELFTRFVEAEFKGSSHGVNIVYGKTHDEYFPKFNQALRTTDVLWTKPSELSFYCGLGLPIVIADPIGSHEEYNRRWIHEIQAGYDQNDPRYTNEWLFDLLNEGRLAEAAWDGFLKARKFGTYKILEILATGVMMREFSPLKR